MLDLTLVADSAVALRRLKTRTQTQNGRLRDVTRAALWTDPDGDGVPDTLLSSVTMLANDGTADFRGFDLRLPRNGPTHLIVTHDFHSDGRVPYDFRTGVTEILSDQVAHARMVDARGLPIFGDTVTVLRRANRPPEAPRLVSPRDRADSVPTTVGLVIGPFEDIDGDTQGGTQWQVSDSRGVFVNSAIIAGVVTAPGVADTLYRFARGMIKGYTTYTWRARVSDAKGAWSAWSETRSFTTGQEPLEVVYRYDTVTVEVHHHHEHEPEHHHHEHEAEHHHHEHEAEHHHHEHEPVVHHHYETVTVREFVPVAEHHHHEHEPVQIIQYETVTIRETVPVEVHHHEHEANPCKGNNGLGNGGEICQGEDSDKGEDPSNPGQGRQPRTDDRIQFSLKDAASGQISIAGTVDYEEEVPPPARKRMPSSKFKYGLHTYQIENIPVGAASTIKITMPENVPEEAQYWLWDSSKGWMDMTSQLGSMDGDKTVELTLVDGGPGDLDGVANGKIVDPAGFVFPEAQGAAGGGSSGGSAPGIGGSKEKSVACVITRCAGRHDLSMLRNIRDGLIAARIGRTLVDTYYRCFTISAQTPRGE